MSERLQQQGAARSGAQQQQQGAAGSSERTAMEPHRQRQQPGAARQLQFGLLILSVVLMIAVSIHSLKTIRTQQREMERSLTASFPKPTATPVSSTPSVTPRPPNNPCECTTISPPECCQRAILMSHKMGNQMAIRIASNYYKEEDHVQACEVSAQQWWLRHFQRAYQHPKTDYRHIFITRNFVESLISGYFYHREGRECWLNKNGRRQKNQWLNKEKWMRRIAQEPPLDAYLLNETRTLCQFLKDEEPKVGMRVYFVWAKVLFLDPVYNFYRERSTNDTKRTLHLCFEDFANISQALEPVTQWFKLPLNVHRTYANAASQAARHSAKKDPHLVANLKDLIDDLDQELYNGMTLQRNREMGCGMQ